MIFSVQRFYCLISLSDDIAEDSLTVAEYKIINDSRYYVSLYYWQIVLIEVCDSFDLPDNFYAL